MIHCPHVQARPAGPLLAPINACCAVTRSTRSAVTRLALGAALPFVTSTGRDGPLTLRRPNTTVWTNASANANIETGYEGLEDDKGDDEEFIPPPLPASALELLSEVLTGIATSSMEDPTPGASAFNNALNSKSPGAYQPLRFCVNCCRPLPASGALCSGCGHDPHRDVEVLGDPNAWVQGYAEQLQRQQQQQQEEQLQRQQQQQREHHQVNDSSHAAAVPITTATSPAARGSVMRSNDVLLAADARTLLHRSSLPPYPGRPERLQAIMSRLHSRGLMDRCRLLPCRPAADSELLRVHSPELVAAVLSMGATHHSDGSCSCSCGGDRGSNSSSNTATSSAAAEAAANGSDSTLAHDMGGPAGTAAHSRPLCADTLYNAHTCTAALLAAGAAADVGMALATGKVRAALAVMRPPGAQAGVNVARGGCYLNNVAVAAAAALSSGLQRVMIVDWDVHHGRGTQEIFSEDPRVMVVSMHRYDSEIYPGSGSVEEVGEGEGEGFTLNVAFARGSASGDAGSPANGGLVNGDLLSAALHVVMPVAYQFRPQLVLVAAGFGALRGDPIGGCSCSPAVFAHLTHMLAGVAPRGLGLLLEGGYNLAATSEAVEGCLRVLLGEAPLPLSGPWGTTSEGWVAIMNAMQIHSHFWSALHPLSFHGWTSAIANQQRQLQQQEEQEEQERLLALERQREEEEEEAEALRAHYYGPQPGGAGGQSDGGGGGGGGWGGLRDDDHFPTDEVVGDGDEGDEGKDDGLSPEDLAHVAAALQRTRKGWALEHGVGGGESVTAAMAAAELEDPRDIDPTELLDVFLGMDSSSSSGGGDGSNSSSSSSASTAAVTAFEMRGEESK
ncbi:hypothetical protein Vretimale_4217 [Volvox reticuliferus]|uniref:Histone deacetylase domain-containing protein n=1 Tax=Volvox reticuliferus TaxID=1737510 RepID=A0A8J4C1M8_9CHLO|nr:hypothetical protein Vretifemale_2773 [Volvox reticuliferus]GIL98886.1 hypothetical protein Vretimale_4217 [Volvox reticuliferus]